jgi:hypothetical protein
MKSVFWDMTPCSPLKVNRCFTGAYLCAAFLNLRSCMASAILTTEAVCSSERSPNFQHNKQRYIPRDRTLNLFMFPRS